METAGRGAIPGLKYTMTLRKDHHAYEQISEVVYWVWQEENFIYSWTVHGRKKEVLATGDFGKVDFQAQMSPSLFDIPNTARKVEASSQEEMRKLLNAGTSLPPQTAVLLSHLNNAMEESARTSFAAKNEELNGAGKKAWRTYYQLYEEKTTFLSQRVDAFYAGKEISQPEAMFQSTRIGPDGWFICFGEYAIRLKHVKVEWKIWNFPQIPRLPNAPISIFRRDFNRNGAPCYEYIVRYPADYPVEQLAQTAVKYIVGRDRNFVYAWTQYDTSGKETQSCDFGEVDFAPDLSTGFFFADQGAKISVANSKEEYESVKQKIFKKQYDEYKKKRSKANNASWISYIIRYGVWVTLPIAVISIIAVVALKVRFKKENG